MTCNLREETMRKSVHTARGARQARQKRMRRLRVVSFVMISVLVLGVTSYLLISAFVPITPAPAANTIDISADMAGFSMQEIRLQVGKPATLRLTSLDTPYHTDGGGRHQLAVDELGVNLIAPPEGSNSATFTPEKPGTYTFYCDICCGGRANPSMQGTLIVEA